MIIHYNFVNYYYEMNIIQEKNKKIINQIAAILGTLPDNNFENDDSDIIRMANYVLPVGNVSRLDVPVFSLNILLAKR